VKFGKAKLQQRDAGHEIHDLLSSMLPQSDPLIRLSTHWTPASPFPSAPKRVLIINNEWSKFIT
jgi:hypothetical protein